MARHRWPLPYWCITDAPSMQTCSGAIYRACLAMAVAYWRAECRLDAVDEVTACAITRLPVAAWRMIKDEVMRAMTQDIGPALRLEYNDKASKLPQQREHVRLMIAARAKKRAERILKETADQPKLGAYATPHRQDTRPHDAPATQKTTTHHNTDRELTSQHPPPLNTNTAPSLAQKNQPANVSRETQKNTGKDRPRAVFSD